MASVRNTAERVGWMLLGAPLLALLTGCPANGTNGPTGPNIPGYAMAPTRHTAGQKTQPYPHLYTVDGKPLNAEPSKGLMASNAVAALLVEKPLAERFVNDLWKLDPPGGQWRYYDGLLQFMAMLHVTGRFKAW